MERRTADSSDVPQTPYAVAFRLAQIIANIEGKALRTVGSGSDGGDRNYVLQLYRECLEAVGSQGPVFSP
jgi:hypothetical protein